MAPPRPHGYWLALASVAGLAGGVAIGVLELLWMLVRSAPSVALGVLPTLTFDAALGLVLAWVLLLGRLLLAGDPRLGELFSRWWRAGKLEPEQRAGYAATGLSVMVAPLGVVAAGIPVARALLPLVANDDNAPLLQVPALVALCLLGLLLSLPLQRLLTWALRPLARRAPAAVRWLPFAVAGSGAAVALLVVLTSSALRSRLSFTLLIGLGLLLAACIGAARLLHDPVRRRPRLFGGASLAAAAAVTVAIFLGSHWQGARLPMLSANLVSRVPLGIIDAVTDRDGDGFSYYFLADCDDRNKAINPDAVDVPDNGLDENCDGADAHRVPVEFGPAPWPGLAPEHRKPKSVLLITIDAVRVDHVGAYGPTPRPLTPRFDAFAAGATLFERAYSPGSATLRVVPGILSGAHPLGLRWTGIGSKSEIDLSHTTIAEVFSRLRYHTAAVDLAQKRPRRGFDQGFGRVFRMADVPLEVYRAGNAAASVNVATAWLDGLPNAADGGKAPFFMWIHLIDPHHPYHPHPDSESWGTDERSLYAGEIAYSDTQLGRLLDHLNALGLSDSTVVVIGSDHGEHFGEHGEHFHGNDVWEEVVRVPLAIRLPGAPARRIETPVSLLDVAWTVYDLAGVPTGIIRSTRPRHGMSLAGAVADGIEPPARLHVTAAWHRRTGAVLKTGAVRWPLVLREDPKTSTRSCFDLSTDPKQAEDLWHSRPDVCRKLYDELGAWRYEVMGSKKGPPKAKRPAKKTPARTSAPKPAPAALPRPSPKSPAPSPPIPAPSPATGPRT